MARSSCISRLQGAPTGVSIVVGALRKRDCLDCLEIADAVRSYRCLVVLGSAFAYTDVGTSRSAWMRVSDAGAI
jgi:hypothetical protein